MSGRVTEAILREICPKREGGDSLSIPGPTFLLFMLLFYFQRIHWIDFAAFNVISYVLSSNGTVK